MRVEFVGQGVDQREDLGVPQGAADLFVGGIGTGIEKIGADGVVEQMSVLGDDADAMRKENRVSHRERRGH